MNRDNEDINSREGNLRIVARAKRKRNSQIFKSDDETGPDDDRAPIRTLMKRSSQIITSDDETSCDDTAPISTLVRSRIGPVDEVKEDSSRRSLKSVKIERPGEISDDDDTSNGDSVPKSAIKTRYRSKRTKGSVDEVKEDSSRWVGKISDNDDESSYEGSVPKSVIKTRYRAKRTIGLAKEDARKRRLTRLRKTETKNEQDDKNSFDLNKSVCLKEISSSDDGEDNEALEDEEDDNSVEDDGDYEGLEDEEDTDGPEDEEDFDNEQDEEDSDDLEDKEDFDGELDEEDNDSVDEDDDGDGDSTNKSENAIIDSEGNLGIILSAKRKRTSLIFTSDDETSCDDKAPISTLMRSRIDSEDEVKGNASRQSLRSAKTKRAGKISDDDDETDYEGSAPKNTIKTRYRSKCMTGFEDAGKRNL
uniref:acidic leucine-rich nuclear phosphoprotein 32-related protein 1-like n=1 Tax=Erigeron canadensis TaxID=72917 RepID=UPI001CB8F088|nr:acidic leucine-rich nuclear phosphoprotein 32-related protein 1-like [Erigeron canadensis]